MASSSFPMFVFVVALWRNEALVNVDGLASWTVLSIRRAVAGRMVQVLRMPERDLYSLFIISTISHVAEDVFENQFDLFIITQQLFMFLSFQFYY